MTERTVTTQAGLDAALADSRENPDDHYEIHIRSERGVWLVLRDTGSATVRAFDSATVEAFDSATVEAFGSATVRAFDSATVRASDSATVRAGSHTAVHLHSGRCSIEGGVLIDHTAIDETDVATWASYHGATVDGDHLTAYKAVRDDYRSARGTEYRPGSVASCDDFTDTDECGGGLHFSPSPVQAHAYDREATRFIELRVDTASVRTITGGGTAKAKARSVRCIREVDIHARPIGGAS